MRKFDEKSCGIVLFRRKKNETATPSQEKEFLLLQYPQGHWDFVKGHMENNEDELTTARRELLEETGIDDLIFIGGFREKMTYKYEKYGKISHKQVVFFLGETKETKLKLSHEHQNFVWLPWEKALNRLTFENARKVLREALKFL